METPMYYVGNSMYYVEKFKYHAGEYKYDAGTAGHYAERPAYGTNGK